MLKRDRNNEKQLNDFGKKKRPKITIVDAPPINSIKDLIELGKK